MDYIKGEKIGEVTLDLKGKTYEGTPPDFSSTYGLGTKIYEIKGVKKENAVLMVSGEMNHILYRSRKAVASENEPIGLKVEEVINMISDNPVISSVELKNEVDGSWMRTSYDSRLLDLLNTEIKGNDILSYEEMGRPEGESSYRIPINIMIEDGAVLHMQAYPESDLDGNLVITVKLGESEENSKEIEIYEGTDQNLFFKVEGEIYNIVKGSLQYKS